MMNEIKKHPHDVDIDVGLHTKWGSLLSIIRQVGYPVLLLRLNGDMPEGTGFLVETEQQYRQIIQSWMDQYYKENLHIRIVPGDIAKA